MDRFACKCSSCLLQAASMEIKSNWMFHCGFALRVVAIWTQSRAATLSSVYSTSASSRRWLWGPGKTYSIFAVRNVSRPSLTDYPFSGVSVVIWRFCRYFLSRFWQEISLHEWRSMTQAWPKFFMSNWQSSACRFFLRHPEIYCKNITSFGYETNGVPHMHMSI